MWGHPQHINTNRKKSAYEITKKALLYRYHISWSNHTTACDHLSQKATFISEMAQVAQSTDIEQTRCLVHYIVVAELAQGRYVSTQDFTESRPGLHLIKFSVVPR